MRTWIEDSAREFDTKEAAESAFGEPLHWEYQTAKWNQNGQFEATIRTPARWIGKAGRLRITVATVQTA